MTRLLSLFGLMRVSEHERGIAYFQKMEKAANETADLWEAKFKKAVTNLADASDEFDAMRRRADRYRSEADYWCSKCKTLLPDAQKWRDRAERERQRGQNKRAGGAK